MLNCRCCANRWRDIVLSALVLYPLAASPLLYTAGDGAGVEAMKLVARPFRASASLRLQDNRSAKTEYRSLELLRIPDAQLYEYLLYFAHPTSLLYTICYRLPVVAQ